MRLDHYPEGKLKRQILKIVGKYLDLKTYHVFIFGSRAGSSGPERSDIDIGILGPQEIPGNIRIEILEELENLPVLYRFDLVDFHNVTPEFKKEALKTIEYVN